MREGRNGGVFVFGIGRCLIAMLWVSFNTTGDMESIKEIKRRMKMTQQGVYCMWRERGV